MNKSKSSLLFFMLLVSGNAIAQCNDWEKLISYDKVLIQDQARDRFGNVYVVGWFNSDNFTIGGTTLPRYGDYSLFVLKFDKNFSLLWGKSVGNDSQDLAYSVDIDNGDNPVISGYYFSSSIQFDCITLVKSSDMELFLVKYNPEGTVLWAIGTSNLQHGISPNISIFKTNNIILTSKQFVALNLLGIPTKENYTLKESQLILNSTGPFRITARS